MIGKNIRYFRKRIGYTQEQLAETLNVSRQTIAKWENEEVTPNIEDCKRMQELFDISLDDLVREMTEEELLNVTPRGKHIFGMVTVGERGQVVLPKKCREIFQIKPGDKIIVLGDEQQGIAMIKADAIHSFHKMAMRKAEE
ncbi:MAG: helix-turn-helix domain-containing protein [Firmicutes bacterium]|nr:helix-turn-helix domain-containing protein [Bacillota bacterium]MDD7601812.1 helix-turn-helix domain-containing protein [Bacillota bacterium]MDY5855825.1 helix-turn-helix domain-containing protein [Anaerovoracaceae bacterium]